MPAIGASIPTLQSMVTAIRTQDYTLEAHRRFRGEHGTVTTVRERLEVEADGSFTPRFRLTFLGVVGEPPGSPVEQRWSATYRRFGPMFVQHGSFRIRSLTRASANYTLHDFGPVVRAGRTARRMVVFPNSSDKAIWVVDVDAATHVVLFFAEFDSQLRLQAELEPLAFQAAVQTPVAAASVKSGTSVTAYDQASAAFAAINGVLEPKSELFGEYDVERVEIHADPLSGRRSLVLSYTDGIDHFVVSQTPNTPDPFGTLPSGGGGHTIARFRDSAVTALVFWRGGTSFHVSGRGSLVRLDEIAKRLYQQALSAN